MNYEWHVCKNYPDFSITKQGLMKNNRTGNIIQQQTSKSDIHLYYSFIQDGIAHKKAIRYLVAEQFIPNPEDKKYVIYIDGNPENCSVENLKWSNTRTYLKKNVDSIEEDAVWYPWKECAKYDINKKGQMRNHETFRILKPSLANDGYLYYSPVVDGKVTRIAAHVCVAKQFIPNPENKRVVNHKDEDRTNCHIKNLEWVTHKENSNHATAAQRIGKSKEKPINEYDLDGHYIRTWKSIYAFYSFYGLDYFKTGQGQALRIAARNNLNTDAQMRITFGRIFTYYQNSTDNIFVNCTKRSIARAQKPFKNQNIPKQYLYSIDTTIVTHIQVLSEMLTKVFLTQAQKNAINYAIQCINDKDNS